jgi:mono/diheme cytochrome c family protein
MNPQRLDTLLGKILRIVPDLREHPKTSSVTENGRYRIPHDNPFATVEGARKEIWAYGLRNPHRLFWDVDPESGLSSVGERAKAATLLAFNIGLAAWETVVVIHRGANYGYPLREGTNSMSPTNGIGPLPDDDTIPIQISDTVARGTVKPTYPVIQYSHDRQTGGDAVANGFVYRGKSIPVLKGKLVFGDITTGRLWYANRDDVRAADDGNAKTVAPIYEIETTLRRMVEETYRERGGKTPTLPGMAAVSGPGRVDVRFAEDDDGELYLLTKADGVIRKIVGGRDLGPALSAPAPTASRTQNVTSQPAAGVKNPVAPTTESMTAGKRAYEVHCAACHGSLAQGAAKGDITISIIEEQKGRQPPDLTDAQRDHGSTDGEIFNVIKRGLPPTMMAGYDGRIADAEIWSIVNYLRSLGPGK